ncbi:hypothetical protein JL720_1869 [Aureococcus anophagefferens]|nr:hypothetical protein JL720_1869 [Aureococcus anophagefferens]
MATFKSIFLAMIAAASAFTRPAAPHLRRATIRSEQKGYYVPRPANKDISKSGGAPPPPRPASTDDAAAAESLAALMNSRKPAPPPPRPVAREAEAAKEREREQIRQQQLAAEAQAREREEQLRREQAEAKQQAEAEAAARQREAELRAQQAREERLRQEQARVEQARRVPVAPQLDQTVPMQTERVPVAPQLDQTVPVQTERVPVAPQLEETVPVQTERVPVAPQMEATAPVQAQRVPVAPQMGPGPPPPPEGSRVLVPEAPSAEPAWASVTSGGAPPAAPNAKPLKSMSPVEFQKQWASNIIATAGRQKKLGELKQVMGDLADKGLQVSPSPLPPPPAAAPVPEESPLPPVPAAAPLPEVSPGALRLADIFDGRLGPTKLSLRSDDAMMSLSGVFTAYAANKPASGRDLVALRCANGAEIVIDAARCRDVSFDDRRAPDGDAALSVFFSNVDGAPFLSATLDGGGGPPPPRRAGEQGPR